MAASPPAKRARLAPPPSAPPFARLPIQLPPVYLPPQTPATPFQQPTPLTSCSVSAQREFLFGPEERNASLACYRKPELGVDLNRGFQDCIWRDGNLDEGLDGLLDAFVPASLLWNRIDDVDWIPGQRRTELAQRQSC